MCDNDYLKKKKKGFNCFYVSAEYIGDLIIKANIYFSNEAYRKWTYKTVKW